MDIHRALCHLSMPLVFVELMNMCSQPPLDGRAGTFPPHPAPPQPTWGKVIPCPLAGDPPPEGSPTYVRSTAEEKAALGLCGDMKPIIVSSIAKVLAGAPLTDFLAPMFLPNFLQSAVFLKWKTTVEREEGMISEETRAPCQGAICYFVESPIQGHHENFMMKAR